MKSLFKRASAALLALAMCVSLTGCYSESKSWAAKLDDTTMSIGSYIYYYTSAYSEGSGYVDSEAKVLKSDIEGQPATEWISNRALDLLRSYYYVDHKFNELGLSLSDEDIANIDNATASMWSYYKTVFEDMGVSENSFREAYAVYNLKSSLLLQALYGKGGELEVPEDELHDYYTDNYIYYQYFRVDLTETDEDGNSVDMDDDRKAEIKELLEDYAEDVTKGSQTIDHAAANCANVSDIEPYLGEPAAVLVDNLGDAFKDSLESLKNDEAAFVETDTAYYIVQRLDVEDDFTALMEDSDRLNSLISSVKGEDFMDFTIQEGAKLDINVNNKAIATVKPNKVAEAMGEDGTSYAPVEDETGDDAGSSDVGDE